MLLCLQRERLSVTRLTNSRENGSRSVHFHWLTTLECEYVLPVLPFPPRSPPPQNPLPSPFCPFPENTSYPQMIQPQWHKVPNFKLNKPQLPDIICAITKLKPSHHDGLRICCHVISCHDHFPFILSVLISRGRHESWVWPLNSLTEFMVVKFLTPGKNTKNPLNQGHVCLFLYDGFFCRRLRESEVRINSGRE